MPIGSITRGTTGTNRLRRVDRWIAAHPAFLRAAHPLVVDLGYGAAPTTTLELHRRLSTVRSNVEVVGIEIDPERVRAAAASALPGISFRRGGFEVPLPQARKATVIRALNVLRQYDESDVLPHWRRMAARLADGGVLVEGTCSELGRVASWVDVTADGPETFTISLRLTGLEHPSIVAERLPKALIHRNIDPEPVHELLRDLDREWAARSPLSAFGPTQRWVATVDGMRRRGWPISKSRSRARLGELTIAWSAVAPIGFSWNRD